LHWLREHRQGDRGRGEGDQGEGQLDLRLA
jgi:hypothetical protein